MFGLLGNKSINVGDIKTLHRLFYKSIDENNAGEWRKVNVIVTGSNQEFPAPDMLDTLMTGLDRWIEGERGNMHPVCFAAMLHLKFVAIHPFTDGNGRVARLLMNAALIQNGYMLAIIPPVLRPDYLAAIRRYRQKDSAGMFCDFIAERVYESEKEVMRLLHIPPYNV
jgi:Fic family protein